MKICFFCKRPCIRTVTTLMPNNPEPQTIHYHDECFEVFKDVVYYFSTRRRRRENAGITCQN